MGCLPSVGLKNLRANMNVTYLPASPYGEGCSPERMSYLDYYENRTYI